MAKTTPFAVQSPARSRRAHAALQPIEHCGLNDIDQPDDASVVVAPQKRAGVGHLQQPRGDQSNLRGLNVHLSSSAVCCMRIRLVLPKASPFHPL